MLGGADAVLSVLADGPATLATIDRASAGLRPGTLWIQAATVGVDETAQIAERIAAAECALVDAPVLGTRGPARADADVSATYVSTTTKPREEVR